MSASREKKRRQSQPEVTPVEAAKKGMSPCLKKTLTAVVAIVLVVAIIFLGLVGSGFMQKYTTAAVANGHKLTPAMLNYFYVSAYSNMSSYIGTVIDTEVPLSEQEYGGEGYDTWADYIIDMAASNAANTYAMYDEAIANGFELSEDAQATIDSELQMLDLYGSMYGYADGNGMLVGQYGAGCNKDNYLEYLTVNNIATEYANKIQSELTYTAEEIEAYYTENQNAFDAASYRYFSVTPATLGLEDGEESLKVCEETAKSIAEAAEGGELAFMDAVFAAIPEEEQPEYDVETATIREDVSYDAIPEAYQSWVKDEARQEGDVTWFENGENSYAVVYFLRHEDHSYLLPNVRHILISFTAEDEASKTTAKEKAEEILDTYLAGEQTEEAFAKLAEENSEDNAEDGGLYENITPGMMVETFDAWCYDEAREVGDTDIVETEYGYHVMYFVGYGDTYQDYLVENELRSNDYYEWSQSITGDVTYEVKEGAKRFLKNI